MERTSVGYSWRGPHGRLDPLDQRSPARARARSFVRLLARSLARPPGHTGPAASRGEPVRRHDEWSAHYGEVPATKSRDEMSPFACERRVSIRRGEARRGRDSGEADAGRSIVSTIGRAPPIGWRVRADATLIGSRRIAGREPRWVESVASAVTSLVVGVELVGAYLPIGGIARPRLRDRSGREEPTHRAELKTRWKGKN